MPRGARMVDHWYTPCRHLSQLQAGGLVGCCRLKATRTTFSDPASLLAHAEVLLSQRPLGDPGIDESHRDWAVTEQGDRQSGPK
jgi:hypothetical protein